eukprot:2372083-Pyramimonas_sp.AAC.1
MRKGWGASEATANVSAQPRAPPNPTQKYSRCPIPNPSIEHRGPHDGAFPKHSLCLRSEPLRV